MEPDDSRPTQDQDARPRGIKRLAAFATIAVLGIVLSSFTPVGEVFTKERMGQLAAELGIWGPAAILALGTAGPLLLLPRWPVAFAAGLLYGITLGSLYANVASTLGAWLHFALTQSLLAPAADRLRRKNAILRLDVPRDKAFLVFCMLRVFPLSSYVVTNMMAGILRIRAGTFLASTFIGMIPSTIVYAAWGMLVKKPDATFYYTAAFTLLVFAAGTWLAQRHIGRWLKHRPEAGA